MNLARVEAINDFVIRFANVNGTGSASANAIVAKSIFRSGVPIGPKNISLKHSRPANLVRDSCL